MSGPRSHRPAEQLAQRAPSLGQGHAAARAPCSPCTPLLTQRCARARGVCRLAVAQAVAEAGSRDAAKHEEELRHLTLVVDEESQKQAMKAAVEAAVARVQREAEADKLRCVAEARAEARADATERVSSECQLQMEDVERKAR